MAKISSVYNNFCFVCANIVVLAGVQNECNYSFNDPNSTTDRTFVIYEAGDASYINYTFYINTVSSVIFTILCVLLNIGTFVAYKQHVNRIAINGSNTALIEKKLLIYAMATFLGHLLVASMFLITIITNIDDPETTTFLYINYPLIMDTGTVVLSSWLLLWASSTIRQQLIKDFAIIRIRNNRVGPMEGPQNNNHLAVGGVVGDKLEQNLQIRATIAHNFLTCQKIINERFA